MVPAKRLASTDHQAYRCSYCNNVNAMEIADGFMSKFSKVSMRFDPHDNTKIICDECLGGVNEALSDFYDEYDTMTHTLHFDYVVDDNDASGKKDGGRA